MVNSQQRTTDPSMQGDKARSGQVSTAEMEARLLATTQQYRIAFHKRKKDYSEVAGR